MTSLLLHMNRKLMRGEKEGMRECMTWQNTHRGKHASRVKRRVRDRVEEGSLPGDVGMINVKLSERWRGETTVLGEESWPGVEQKNMTGGGMVG